nr:hypothetical protein [Pacificoceanicola onchidii]
MDLKPQDPHQRVGTILGSRNEVDYLVGLMASDSP